MKNYFKLLTIIIISFVMMIGINVNAEDDYYIFSSGSRIQIDIPIHKTDSNKKALEGAIFTLKDFNNTISYSSSDERDGDYLIDVSREGYPKNASSRRENDNQEYRIVDITDEDSTLTKILDVLPSKYSDVFRKAETQDDLNKMLDLPVFSFAGGGDLYYEVGFYIPLKVEETKVPAGYKAKNIVIPAFVYLSFDDGSIFAFLGYTPGYMFSPFGFEATPAYFEYSDGTDYEALFDKINKKLSSLQNEDELLDLLEDNGAIIDNDCDIHGFTPSQIEREDLEARFDPEIEEVLCPINLVDEKEDIIVNPETAGTIGIVTLLIVISFGIIISFKKLRNN